MSGRLPNTDLTVMTGHAIVGNAHVAKRCISKVGDVMANGAILVVRRGRYVVQKLAHTNPAVVARSTVSDDTKMVIGACAKGAGSMANTTILTGRHVCI